MREPALETEYGKITLREDGAVQIEDDCGGYVVIPREDFHRMAEFLTPAPASESEGRRENDD